MSAKYTYYTSGEEVVEPKLLTTLVNITITNTGDEAGTDLGFYIKTPSTAGSFDYQATDAPVTNYFDIIKQGDLGFGLVVHQGAEQITIDSENGSNALNKIPLTVGSGVAGNILAVGETISIILSITFSPSYPNKNVYVDFILE